MIHASIFSPIINDVWTIYFPFIIISLVLIATIWFIAHVVIDFDEETEEKDEISPVKEVAEIIENEKLNIVNKTFDEAFLAREERKEILMREIVKEALREYNKKRFGNTNLQTPL